MKVLFTHVNMFKILTVCVCIYICILNINSKRSYMQTRLILDAINRLTALIYIKSLFAKSDNSVFNHFLKNHVFIVMHSNESQSNCSWVVLIRL